MTDEWEPITEAELLERIDAEETQMSAAERAEFAECRVALCRATVKQFNTDEVEQVFIVARRGTQAVFFDDVEDEFATGIADQNGAISNASLHGELRWAVRSLRATG